MLGTLLNQGYGWGPLTSRMHISVRVNPNFQRYFTCYWKECYYEFLRMPNGYAQAQLLFTKLLKQPFGFLRKHGYALVGYIDDSYLQGDTHKHCLESIHATRDLLVLLGFSINYVKSVFQPAQRITFLGFVLDSLTMSISLTDKCESVLLNACHNLASVERHKIRIVASAVSCIIAALPGVKYGGLFYRNLERCKNIALNMLKATMKKPCHCPHRRNRICIDGHTTLHLHLTSFIHPLYH